MLKFNFPAQRGCRSNDVLHPGLRTSGLRWRLLAGMAGAALLASAPAASAEGLTFTWTGADNGTSYGREGNWEVVPVLDEEGNAVETDAILPSGGDWAIVTAGTPTMSSKGGWSISGLDLSGGQFTVRSSQLASSNFTADTLLLSGTGQLSIGSDEKYGASWFATSNAIITGGAASGFGILNVTKAVTQSDGDVSQLTINTPSYTHSGGTLGALVTTGTYELTSAAARSTGATIVAADLFHLWPDSGMAIVDARLSGTGDLVKSGAGTVVLTNDNAFTGSVVIEAGLLELRNGKALSDGSAVRIADVAGATLLLTNSETIGSLSGGGAVLIAEGMTLTVGDETDTTFLGTIGGETGALVKQGIGTLTLGRRDHAGRAVGDRRDAADRHRYVDRHGLIRVGDDRQWSDALCGGRRDADDPCAQQHRQQWPSHQFRHGARRP